MKTRLLVRCGTLGIAGFFFTAAVIQVSAHPPADSGFTADKGRFRILQQGNEVGSEDFSLQPSGNGWVMEDQTVIRASGSAEMRTSGQLRMLADGTPQRYTWSAQSDKKASGTVDFDSGTAKTSVDVSGAKQPVHQDFKFASPRVAVLDNNLYDQYAVLGRLYDWDAKGTQKFPVLIPQDATPGSIDVEALGEKDVEGTNLQVLRVRSTDLEIQLYFDAKLHLIRLEVPAASVVIARQ